MSASKVRFQKMRDGRYLQPESGIELIKGIDDSDGCDCIEWNIWTSGMGKPLGKRNSLSEAKARVREILEA